MSNFKIDGGRAEEVLANLEAKSSEMSGPEYRRAVLRGLLDVVIGLPGVENALRGAVADLEAIEVIAGTAAVRMRN